LHDIGKAKIPKSIVESTALFEKNSRNLQILRSHPVFGADLLSRMNQPNSVVNMAHFHHVKQNTNMLSSYPIGIPYKKVSFETRLLAIIDIYQALTGKRRYQKSWSPPATMRYLSALAGVEYDLRVWESFLQMMGVYPKGSLVKLSDGRLGFVMNVPAGTEHRERPLVAVVVNRSGEMLGHPDLVNLRVEKDLRIIEDIDSQTVFGDRAVDVFTHLNLP
jgi:HD-GYP domain-containing protein (c-di-GMP phosphodiesterase class II)